MCITPADGAVLRSAEQLRTELSTLVFTPDRLVVVKGGPATRRAYVDRSLGRLYPARARLPVDAEVNRLNDQVLVRYYEREWKDIAH